jgi:hypothetical protein
MLKERIYYLISSLFIGLLIIYLINKPPIVFVTHPNINKIPKVKIIDEDSNNKCLGTKLEVIEC